MLDSKKNKVGSLFFIILIAVGYILKLVLSFEGLPGYITYIGDFLFVLSILYSYSFQRISRLEFKAFLVFFVTTLIFILSSYIAGKASVFAIYSYSRIYLPFLVYFSILKNIDNKFERQFVSRFGMFLIILINILLIIGFIYLPSHPNRLEIWFPAYFQGLHSSAYVMVISYFIFCALAFNSNIYRIRYEIAYILLTSLYLVKCFGVRTAMIAFLFFILLRLVNALKISVAFTSFYIFLAILLFIFATDLFNNIKDYDHVTSGRLSMYGEKIDQLSRNGVAQWLIGNGVGSDWIETKIWWWAPKTAHNDYLTILVEAGFVGLFSLFYIVFMVYKTIPIQVRNIGIPVLLSFLLTSAGSNGIMVRPVASYLLFYCLSVLYARSSKDTS